MFEATKYFNAGLLFRSQYAFGRSCDKYFVGFLRPTTNVKSVPKFRVSLQYSCAVLPSEFSPKRSPHNILKHFDITLFPNTKFYPNAQLLFSAAYCQNSSSCHLTFVTSSLPLPEGQAVILLEYSEQ
jgi:hypothetical protein